MTMRDGRPARRRRRNHSAAARDADDPGVEDAATVKRKSQNVAVAEPGVTAKDDGLDVPKSEPEKHYSTGGWLEELSQSPRSTCCGARDFFQLYPWWAQVLES